MSRTSQLQSELDAKTAALAALPVDAAQRDLQAAQDRFTKAKTLSDSTFSADYAKELYSAEAALTQTRITTDAVKTEAINLQRRIDEITLILACGSRVDAANQQINALNADLLEATHTANMIDAALAKLEAMRETARDRLTQYAENSAEQLLQDAGLPGQDVTTPKSAEVTKTQHEVAAVQIAIAKAQANQAAQQATITAMHAELHAAQRDLMDATADSLQLNHAQALGQYLPFLAAMRSAEQAARGYTSPAVNVEAMAREMNSALNTGSAS